MRVIQTSMDEDLSLFSRYLWQHKVRHRIFEERGSQILEVADPGHQEGVRGAYRAWLAGELVIPAVPPAAKPAVRRTPLAALTEYPGLTLLIVLACAVFPFSYPLDIGRITTVAGWLTIMDLHSATLPLPGLGELLARGEVWRWFTPVLLHFTATHLAFNCAITIYLGRRVESVLGGWRLWLGVMAIGVVSNLAQYAFGSGPLFGGLSGVAYGLVGFLLAAGRRAPDEEAWQLPPPVAMSLLAFLLILSTGVTERFGLFVANAAHWSGLLSGLVLGALLPLGRRDRTRFE